MSLGGMRLKKEAKNKMGFFEILALTFEFSGKILIAITVLLVHDKMRREHKIDKRVLKSIQREEVLGVLGIFLMILGYLMQVYLQM